MKEPTLFVRAAVDDALFALTATRALDVDILTGLARRRRGAWLEAFGSGEPAGLHEGEPWLLALCAAMAPLSPPWWMPLGELVSALSLEHGARGVRSLFTSKPSEKEVARVRRVGAYAVRALSSVLASDGGLGADARLSRSLVVASLGLSPADQQVLLDEPVRLPAELDGFAEIEPKLATLILRGVCYGAAADGLDGREEAALGVLLSKLGLEPSALVEAREGAKSIIEGAKVFGEAAVEGVRWMLQATHDPEAVEVASTVARLALLPPQRKEALTAVHMRLPATLERRHRLGRGAAEAVLGLAWMAALRAEPTWSERLGQVRRHEALARDLDAELWAADVRRTVEWFFEEQVTALDLDAGTSGPLGPG